ncbi:GNAT family N-acetyltransferase [Roseibium aggregatum]|uniref:GNAT family N-acetyltransferase n=1 Tax=Roseibium aggregatum TaxID=187304 RepID=A0A939EED5_9HYPH|nr:GNAT family N-acetyltransferase [Roseibium aggregatum]MBN9671600.1 GNAT family N-acetyltransferase [Roseibium aggregatum]
MRLPDHLTGRWIEFTALGALEVHDLLKLRQDVFIVEQASLFADIDGKDPEALHFLIQETESGQETGRGAIAGAIRLFTDKEAGEARIGRVVIAPQARGLGLGRFLMRAGIEKARELVPGCRILLSAQTYLEEFYRSFGFETVSEIYIEDGIPHVDMVRKG